MAAQEIPREDHFSAFVSRLADAFSRVSVTVDGRDEDEKKVVSLIRVLRAMHREDERSKSETDEP